MTEVPIDLEAAERAGIITVQQVFELRSRSKPDVDEEPVAVANRFSEVFVAIGCYIFVNGLFSVALTQGFGTTGAGLLQLVIASALSEVLYRRQMSFATGASVLLVAWAAHHVAWGLTEPTLPAPGRFPNVSRPATDYAYSIWAASAACAIGLARFRIPFLVLPAAALAAAAAGIFVGGQARLNYDAVLGVIGVGGLSLLTLGAWADRKDRERKGKPSQYAFWLFVAGSPMTVHPVIILVLTNLKGAPSLAIAAVVIALASTVTVLGLYLDRRAPVVSTLIYVTGAIGYLLQSPAVATLLIGVYVLALGLLWSSARRLMVRSLGLDGTVRPERA